MSIRFLVFIVLIFSSISLKSQNLICDDLFYEFNKISLRNSNIGRDPRTLMEAREDVLKNEFRGLKSSDNSFFKKIFSFIKRLFTGRASQEELKEFFGKNWKRYLTDGEIVLRDLDLSDSQFKEIVSYLSKYGRNKSYTFDLHGNSKLSTDAVTYLLQSGLEIHKLDLHGMHIQTNLVVAEIVRSLPNLRELVIDNITDAALRNLSKHKNLRKLDLDKALVKYSRFVGWRYEVNHIIANMLGMDKSDSAATERYEFGSFVTVQGIEEFLSLQKRPIENRNGNVVSFNPHFRELSLPKIADMRTLEKLAQRLKKYEMDESSPVTISFASYSDKFIIKSIKDGDTLEIWDLESPSQPKSEIRLAYIDCFETNGVDALATKIGKAAENLTTYYIERAKEYRRVTVGRKDKYGRYPTLLYLKIGSDWILLNRELYVQGLAVRYDDGSINKEANQDQQGITAQEWYRENKRSIDYWYKK